MTIAKLEAKKMYLDYYTNASTSVTREQMIEITHEYKNDLASWQAESADNKSYEIDFDDTEFLNAKQKGKEDAAKETGYSGNSTGQTLRTIGDATMSAGAGITFVAGGGAKNIVSGAKNIIGKITGSAAKKTGNEVAKTATSKSAKASDIITVTLAAAQEAAYRIKKPNQKEDKAVQEVVKVLDEANKDVDTAVKKVNAAQVEAAEAAEAADRDSQKRDAEILEMTAKYEENKSAYENLIEKRNSGKSLSDAEQRRLEETSEVLFEEGLAEKITKAVDDAIDSAQTFGDQIDSSEGAYDDMKQTLGEVEGKVKYANDISKATKTAATVEKYSQYITMGSAGMATARLAGKGPLGWAFAAVGAAAAVSALSAAGEQGKIVNNTKNTLSAADNTDKIAQNAAGYTEQSHGEFDAYRDFVKEDLEISNPEIEEVEGEDTNTETIQASENDESGTAVDDTKKKEQK